MKLIYNVEDKPKFGQVLIFGLQQLLAIIAATIVVPMLVNNYGAVNLNMDMSAALFGAGIGTLVYILFTRRKSPVFLGSSFAFLSAMYSATVFGFFGIIIGAFLAGLVYVVIAVLIKFVGTKWLSKLLPPVVIGPTVTLIGLSLAGSAITDFTKASATGEAYSLIAIVCALVTVAVTVLISTKAKGMPKLIPFILGILAGYIVATIFTVIGNATGQDALKIIDFTAFTNNFSTVTVESFIHVPKFAFVEAINEITSGNFSFSWANLASIALLYMPVALVVFAEHVADHKNLGSIIGRDLLGEKPGLARTLLGDGVGSMAGALFGCCPNTTYGESIGCVAVTGNASVVTIICTACFAVLLSFFSPFVAFVNTIPSCVFGGICVVLYGYIAVSGLKMIKKVDLEQSRNLFVVSVILITGIGGLVLNFGSVQITGIATALILGILTNVLLKRKGETDEDSSL